MELKVSHTQHTQHFSKGMTIVELIVTMVILSLLLLVFGAAFTSAYNEAFKSRAQAQADSSLQTIFDLVERDVRYASEFKASNDTPPFVDLYGSETTLSSGRKWSHIGDGEDSRVLILQSYATNMRDGSGARRPVYSSTDSAFNCTTQIYYQPKISYLTVYFVKDSKLYRRILTDTITPQCAGQTMAQQQSCPAVVFEAGGSIPETCKARDEEIAKNVQAFKVKYYNDGTLVEKQYEAGAAAAQMVEATTAEISVTVTAPPNRTGFTRTLQVTRIN